MLSSFSSYGILHDAYERQASVSVHEMPGGSMKCTSDKPASRRRGSVSNANVESMIIDDFIEEDRTFLSSRCFQTGWPVREKIAYTYSRRFARITIFDNEERCAA